MADIGHNKPPADYAAKAEEELVPEFKRVYELAAGTNRAIAEIGSGIEDKTQADKLGDFIKQLRAAKKGVNDRRTGITKPLDEKKKAVMSEHKEFVDLCDAIVTNLTQAYLVPWQTKEEERIRAEQEAARKAKEEAERKAQEAAEEAERIKQTAGAGEDVAAGIEAGLEAEKAKDAAKAAKKELAAARKQTAGAGSAGAGRKVSLRTYYVAEITDHNRFYDCYGWNHPFVREALERAAQELARNPEYRKEIMERANEKTDDGVGVGVIIKEEKRAA